MIPLQPDQTALAADVLSRAFCDDPLFLHFFPDEGTRLAQSRHTFRFLLNHAMKNGRVFCTSSRCEGVAAWLPSSKSKRGLWEDVRYGGISMLIHQEAGAIRRQMKESGYMKKIHGEKITPVHWYLSTIGIDRAFRGKGHGDHLIRTMLADIDREKSACYLDTHKEGNVSYYRRFGFEVVHRASPPESAVEHWAMIREPR